MDTWAFVGREDMYFGHRGHDKGINSEENENVYWLSIGCLAVKATHTNPTAAKARARAIRTWPERRWGEEDIKGIDLVVWGFF
eukprot:49994-Amorphochlora_amoeboformis.AAC.1